MTTSAGRAFELPDDDARLGEVVHIAEAGNVVFITRHGETIAELTPPNMVMLARRQAVEMAEAALAQAREAATAILASPASLAAVQVRDTINARVESMVEAAEDALDLALARLTLARIDAGEETVLSWEQAEAQ